MKKYRQRGQAVLLIVLVMVVGLSIGLSVAGRSITNLRVSSETENSQRAFSAAEAGIEQAIKTGQVGTIIGSPVNLGTNATIKSVTVQQLSGVIFFLAGGNSVPKDEGIDIALSDGYPNYTNKWSGSQITLYWGRVNDPCLTAALEIIVLTGTVANPTVTRYALDPCATRSSSNNFSLSGITQGLQELTFNGVTLTFYFRKIITVPAGQGLVMRVIPLYTSTTFGVQGSPSLPIQGKQIDAIGASGSTERAIRVFQSFSELPSEFFNYVLFCAKNTGVSGSCI